MMAVLKKQRILVLALMVAASGLGPGATLAAAPKTTLRACGLVSDPVHASAIAAALSWRDARWTPLAAKTRGARAPGGWMTAYLIPPPPVAPLGIGSFARAQELGAGSDVPTTAINGLAEVAQQLCLTSPLALDDSFTVQLVGRGLRFNEVNQGWSRPLRRPALLHALIVTRPALDAPWSIVEEPEARSALIPGSKLSVPLAADVSTTLVAAAPRRR